MRRTVDAVRKLLRGRRVLVVEDDYLIAMDMLDVLQSLGVTVVGPAGRLDDALSLVQAEGATLDAAVLDLDLGGRSSYPVADALTALGVRVVFVTGFRGEAIPPEYRAVVRLDKPINARALAEALSG